MVNQPLVPSKNPSIILQEKSKLSSTSIHNIHITNNDIQSHAHLTHKSSRFNIFRLQNAADAICVCDVCTNSQWVVLVCGFVCESRECYYIFSLNQRRALTLFWRITHAEKLESSEMRNPCFNSGKSGQINNMQMIPFQSSRKFQRARRNNLHFNPHPIIGNSSTQRVPMRV